VFFITPSNFKQECRFQRARAQMMLKTYHDRLNYLRSCRAKQLWQLFWSLLNTELKMNLVWCLYFKTTPTEVHPIRSKVWKLKSW